MSETPDTKRRTRAEITDDFEEGTRTIRDWVNHGGVHGPHLCEELDAWLWYWGGLTRIDTPSPAPESPAGDDLTGAQRYLAERMKDDEYAAAYHAALATPAPSPAALPEGMTAERLREIAGLLDTHHKWILYRWADALGAPSPPEGHDSTCDGDGWMDDGEPCPDCADAPSPPEGLSPGPVVDGVQVPDGHEVMFLQPVDVDRIAKHGSGTVRDAARATVARRPPVEPPAPEQVDDAERLRQILSDMVTIAEQNTETLRKLADCVRMGLTS